MRRPVLVGILLGISLISCQARASGVSSIVNASGEKSNKISSQEIYEGDLMVTVLDLKDKLKEKVIPRGKCVTRISKDSQGTILTIQVGGINIGVLEDKSKEVSTPDGYYDIDSTLKIVEANFKPQPSVARLGFTRIAYELDKNANGGKLEQYAVVKGVSMDKIDVIEAYNKRSDFPNLNAEIICHNNKPVNFRTVEEALDLGLEAIVPTLPAASQKVFQTKLKAMVAFVQKNGFDWLERNDRNPPQDELAILIDDLATLSVEAVIENTQGKEPWVGEKSLAISRLQSICLHVHEKDIYALYGNLQNLALGLKDQ